jgi:L-threonylcarbamoyladenylate synthase
VSESLSKFSQEVVSDVVSSLQVGGVVLLPTDTVLGLAVLPDCQASVQKLYALKARLRSKALPIMVANLKQVEDLGVIVTPNVEKLLNSPLVPGGLTIVARLNSQTSPKWLQDRSEIAFRIPNSELLLNVLEKTPTTTPGVLSQLNGAPDLVVSGKALTNAPSTLVNCSTTVVTVDRVGAIPIAELSKWVEVQSG